MIVTNLRAKRSLKVILGSLAVMTAPPAFAEDSAFHALECYEDGAIVFTSDVANIAEFDAQSFGVTLSQTISLPEKNAEVYQFIPRDITCFVSLV